MNLQLGRVRGLEEAVPAHEDRLVLRTSREVALFKHLEEKENFDDTLLLTIIFHLIVGISYQIVLVIERAQYRDQKFLFRSVNVLIVRAGHTCFMPNSTSLQGPKTAR